MQISTLQEKRKYDITIILVLLVFIQALAIIATNYFKATAMLDYDSASEVRRAVEMWRYGAIYNATTLGIDHAGFFAAPIYILTGNLGLSIAIIQLPLYVVFLSTILDILKQCGCTISQALFTAFAIFTPYSIGQLEWASMLFLMVGQYEFKVISLLLVIDTLLHLKNEVKSRKTIALILTTSLMLLWTSISSGNYVLCMIVFPLFLASIAIDYRDNKLKICSKSNYCLLLFALSCVLGWKLHNFISGPSIRSSLPLISAGDFLKNIGNAITGFFMLFGALDPLGGSPIFSQSAIMVLIKLLFTAFCVIVAIWRLCKHKISDLFIMTIAVTIVNFGVLCVTNSTYGGGIFEYRYHIIWCVSLLLGVGEVCTLRKETSPVFFACQIALLLVLSLVSFHQFSFMREYNGGILFNEEVIEIANQYDTDTIYMCNLAAESHIIRALDIDKYCICISTDGESFSFDTIGFYGDYADNSRAGEKNILICSENDFNLLPIYIQGSYDLMCSVNDTYQAYLAPVNPWDGISGLPLSNSDRAIDFAYSNGFVYDGSLNENGNLVINSDEPGYVLYGPYTDSVEGTYDITVYYNEGFSGSVNFDVAANTGTVIIASAPLEKSQNHLTLHNVKIDAGQNVEFRLFISSDTEFTFKKFVYERVE